MFNDQYRNERSKSPDSLMMCLKRESFIFLSLFLLSYPGCPKKKSKRIIGETWKFAQQNVSIFFSFKTSPIVHQSFRGNNFSSLIKSNISDNKKKKKNKFKMDLIINKLFFFDRLWSQSFRSNLMFALYANILRKKKETNRKKILLIILE